jgi:hypothetical protein
VLAYLETFRNMATGSEPPKLLYSNYQRAFAAAMKSVSTIAGRWIWTSGQGYDVDRAVGDGGGAKLNLCHCVPLVLLQSLVNLRYWFRKS